MRHNDRFLLIVFFLAFFLFAGKYSFAQKVKIEHFNEMKKLLRNDKKGDAEKILKDLFKSTPSKSADEPKDSTEYWYLSGLLSQYNYEKLNVNVYLNNKVDTAQYYQSLYMLYTSYGKCYDAVKEVDKYAKPLKSTLPAYKDNVIRGGNYFIRKSKYDVSLRYYALFIELCNRSLIQCPDTLLKKVYNNALISASRIKNYACVVQLSNEAIEKGYNDVDVYLLYCDALKQSNDIAKWIKALDSAKEHHPEQFYFYGALIDYYIKENRGSEAMKYAKDLIEKDSTNYLNCFVQGYVYQNVGKVKEAIYWLKRSIQFKADYVPTLSALGHCYVRQAEEMAASINRYRLTDDEKARINSCYTEAQTYLERCEQLMPGEPKLWANGLYAVYYHLNDGVKLERIERLLNHTN